MPQMEREGLTPQNKRVDRFRPKSLETPGALIKVAEYWVAEYGGEGTRFSSEQEKLLAGLIQDGQRAQLQIESGASRAELKKAVVEGRRAKEALVEANIAFALFFARESVGMKHPGSLRRMQEGAAKHQQENPGEYGRGARRYGNNKRGYIGTYAPLSSLKSPHADLNNRSAAAIDGLMVAADKYTPNSNAGFATYAAWSIQRSIDRSLLDENIVRMTHDARSKIHEYFGDHPTEEEDEQMPGLIRELVERADHEPLPDALPGFEEGGLAEMDDPYGEDDHAETLGDIYRDERQDTYVHLSGSALRLQETSLLDDLSEREAGVIRMRFGITDDLQPATLDQIGDTYGVTRDRIRQIESKTMAKLRHPSRSKPLRDFLEGMTPGDALPWDPHMSGDDLKVPQGEATFNTPNQFERGISRVMTPDTFEWLARQERLAAKEDWQLYPGEPWELPPRRTFDAPLPEEADPELFQFIYKVIDTMDAYHFQKSFSEFVGTKFPVGLIKRIDAYRDGKTLTHGQISSIWERFMRGGYKRLEQELGDDFSKDRVGQFFSELIARNVGTPEAPGGTVTLRIPSSEAGQIGYLASNLKFGKVKITGDPGNYVGAHNSSFVEVEVDGNVGDFAGMNMHGEAILTISGKAGDYTGVHARDEAHIEVESARSVGRSGDDEHHVHVRRQARAS